MIHSTFAIFFWRNELWLCQFRIYFLIKRLHARCRCHSHRKFNVLLQFQFSCGRLRRFFNDIVLRLFLIWLILCRFIIKCFTFKTKNECQNCTSAQCAHHSRFWWIGVCVCVYQHDKYFSVNAHRFPDTLKCPPTKTRKQYGFPVAETICLWMRMRAGGDGR